MLRQALIVSRTSRYKPPTTPPPSSIRSAAATNNHPAFRNDHAILDRISVPPRASTTRSFGGSHSHHQAQRKLRWSASARPPAVTRDNDYSGSTSTAYYSYSYQPSFNRLQTGGGIRSPQQSLLLLKNNDANTNIGVVLPKQSNPLSYNNYQPQLRQLQRRDYFDLPSSFSELSRFLLDTIRYTAGLPELTSFRRTQRRIQLQLLEHRTKVNDKLRQHRTKFHDRKLFARRQLLRTRVRGREAYRKAKNERAVVAERWKLRRERVVSEATEKIRVAKGKRQRQWTEVASQYRSGRAFLSATQKRNRALLLHRARRYVDRLKTVYSNHRRLRKSWRLLSSASPPSYYLERDWQSPSSSPEASSLRWTKRILTIPQTSTSSRFDDNGYPLTSRDAITGRFINPWDDKACAQEPFAKLFAWKFARWFDGTGGRYVVPKGGVAEFRKKVEDYVTWNKTRKGEETDCRGTDGISSSGVSATDSTAIGSTHASNSGGSAGVGDRVRMTWIGHATVLVQLHNFTILTDPVMAQYLGPLDNLGIGYERYTPPSLTLHEIGELCSSSSKTIDAVLISHDHYDHLCYATIHDIVTSNDVHVKKWCVPAGFKSWFIDNFGSIDPYTDNPNEDHHGGGGGGGGGVTDTSSPWIPWGDVVEMEWWEKYTTTKSDDDTGETRTMEVTCAPAQHWCSRHPFDRNKRLWCSWAVRTATAADDSADSADNTTATIGNDGIGSGGLGEEQEETGGPPEEEEATSSSLSFYFAGDTGIPRNGFPLHRQIGDRLGPFDLAAIPIGAYEPNDYLPDSHIDPSEALLVHDHIRSRRSVGIHWGAFPVSDEPYWEPPKRLLEELASSSSSAASSWEEDTGGEGATTCGDQSDSYRQEKETVRKNPSSLERFVIARLGEVVSSPVTSIATDASHSASSVSGTATVATTTKTSIKKRNEDLQHADHEDEEDDEQPISAVA